MAGNSFPLTKWRPVGASVVVPSQMSGLASAFLIPVHSGVSPLPSLPPLPSPQIKAPILVLLGADDLRVPPSQGKYLYHTLRAMGKETK